MKVSGYLPSDNEAIDVDKARKDIFYRVRNSGTYGAPQYDADPAISGRYMTAEEAAHIFNVPITVKIDLSANDIKTIATQPIELVAAPGANLALIPIAAAIDFNYGTIAFNAVSGYLEIYTDTGTSQHLRTESAIINSLADKFIMFYHQDGDVADIIKNKGLFLRGLNDSALGDGTASVFLTYQVLITN